MSARTPQQVREMVDRMKAELDSVAEAYRWAYTSTYGASGGLSDTGPVAGGDPRDTSDLLVARQRAMGALRRTNEYLLQSAQGSQRARAALGEWLPHNPPTQRQPQTREALEGFRASERRRARGAGYGEA